MEALKIKVAQMPREERVCALVFHEMSLKTGPAYNSFADTIEGFEDFGDLGKTKYVVNHDLA